MQELSQLQDRVPAFPSSKAEAVVQRELGMPPSKAFQSFQRAPFAAASLGQVCARRKQPCSAWINWNVQALCLTGCGCE